MHTPRQEYIDAFDDAPCSPRAPGLADARSQVPGSRSEYRMPGETEQAPPAGPDGPEGVLAAGDEPDDGPRSAVVEPERRTGRRTWGRTFSGVAAAAVTTVLAVVVAGEVTNGESARDERSASQLDVERKSESDSSRSDARDDAPGGDPPRATPRPLTYQQKLAQVEELTPTLRASGTLTPVAGVQRGAGDGQVLRYRVDVEEGVPLDGTFFAEVVHRTLNDERSWSNGGARSFDRVSSGPTDFVITLASPGTAAEWCAKSGLDITVDNVSCDSAATERVVINAYRWARGSSTYGDQIGPYRQMLINHEVGHRLGWNHLTCTEDGAPAPVMMQQTKTLTTDGRTCTPNPWPHP